MHNERSIPRIDDGAEGLTIVSKRRLGMGPNTVLSMDRDCDQLENVNVLSSTHGLDDDEVCRAVLKTYVL